MRNGPLSILAAAGVLSLALAVPATESPVLAAIQHPSGPSTSRAVSLAGDQPGQILSSKPVTIKAVGFSVPYKAWQLRYVSENTTGQLQTDVATVVKPVKASPTPRLLSYQPAIDSDSPNCQPSYVLTQSPVKLGFEALGGLESFAAVATGTSLGYTVVIPDFEGPHNEWAAGIEAGYGTLDGIRAAENFAPLDLDGAVTPVGLMGYSGGSQASEFAAEEAPTYAPGLNIVGAAIGGLPVNIGHIAAKADGGLFSGVYFAAAVGISRAYPQIHIQSLLNPAGKQMAKAISSMCIVQFVPTYLFQRIESYTKGGLNPLDNPTIQQVIADDTMGSVAVPQIPMQIYMATFDELVVTPDVTTLVNRYCAAGEKIQYIQFPLADHITAEAEGLPGAIAYMEARFAGDPPPSTC
ncbi:MAG: lipase family protein [Streptosporangiaceae bacterium]